MPIVVDVNVIISSLLSNGMSFDVFLLNSLLKKFDFIAPEYLLMELERHEQELLDYTKISQQDFKNVLEFIIEEITFIPHSNFSDKLVEARSFLSKHTKDVPYLALSLKCNSCPIFSGDKILKKLSPVNVLSPRDLLDVLFNTK